MTVEIHNLQTCMDVDLGLVERVVIETLGDGARIDDFSVSIVDDAMIHRINKEHLDHDYPTDVIAFNYGEEGDEAGISGEVIVSAETAIRIASKQTHEPVAELILYVVHGVLHIKGYNDKTPEEASDMWQEQNRIMKLLGFSGEFTP